MFCYGFSIAASLLLLSAPEIQLGDAFSMFPPLAGASTTHDRDRLSAARGEWESIAVWVRNDGESRQLDACTVSWGKHEALAAEVYVVTEGDAPTLAPFESLLLAPDALQHLFLRLQAPAEAPAGDHALELTLQFADGARETVPLRLDVFDFSIPAEPSLPVLLGLDRPAIRQAAGIGDELAAWLPIYALLARLRMGFQVWPVETHADSILYDYSGIDLVKAHLHAVAHLAGAPVVGIGGPAGALLQNWPAPVLDSPQDPLQYLLFSLMGGLESEGWTRPTILIPERLPSRPDWQQIRAAYARVRRLDGRVTRLLAAPVHPFFERYTDIWALPLETPRFALAALRAGQSLVRYPVLPLAACASSESAMDASGTYPTEARDAFDGCEATAWRGSHPDARDETAWLEATLEDLALVEQITILWGGGEPGPLPTLETAYNPGAYSRATVEWETEYNATEGGLAASVGEIKYPRECLALRLHFESATEGVFVAEVLLNRDSRRTVSEAIAPVRPWLDLRTQGAALLAPDTAGIALRAAPWLCWQQGFEGVLGPVLGGNGADDSSGMLTCGPDGVMPGVALFHLADGLDDCAYLQAYVAAVRRGDVEPPADFQPGFLLPPGGLAQGDNALKLLEALREQRGEMGRLLSGHRTVTRNFGPRK